jgi:hypothetical protein
MCAYKYIYIHLYELGEKVEAFFIWPEGHDQRFAADLLIPVPECKSVTLSSGIYTHLFIFIYIDIDVCIYTFIYT